MELRSIIPLLRERWKTITAVTLVAIAVGALLTVRETPWYESRTTLFVSAWAETSDASKAYQAEVLSQQKVKSYTLILRDERLMRNVIARLDLRLSPAALAARISAEAVEDTVLLSVRVADPSPGQAQRIAEALADEFVKLIPMLEISRDGRQPAVRISVISPANLPTTPVSPRPVRNLALSLGVGLLAGFGVAMARRALDVTIKTSEQAEEVASAAVLGVVPYDAGSEQSPFIAGADPHGHRVEAYRHVRTSLQFTDADQKMRVIVVTSAVPEEGKSTTACNLAHSLAEAGKRVLLVDGDLRRPRAAQYLGLPSGAGLTNVLVGQATLDEVIQPLADTNFAVLASGPVPPNPTKLVGSNHLREILAELRERYDLVLIDAPPVLPVADTVLLASASDGAVVVVRHGKTKRDQLSKAAIALRRADVDLIGLVLNMAPRNGSESYYYYYDGYSGAAGDDKLADASPPPADVDDPRPKIALRQ